MNKRQIIISVLGGVIILVLGSLLKDRLGQTSASVERKQNRVTQGVAVDTVLNQAVQVRIPITGRLQASEKVALYAEVNGLLMPGNKPFEEGRSYAQGETILRLEDREEQATYQAGHSRYLATISQVLPDIKLDYPQAFQQWQSYLETLSQNKALTPPPPTSNPKLKLFLTGAQVYSAYQGLVSTQQRLQKFSIRAPFDGVVTEAFTEEGALARPGQALGEFMALNRFELVTTISPSVIEQVQLGDTVRLFAENRTQAYSGEIYRINPKVDPTSQQVEIYIRVRGERLRDGQYLRGTIAGRQIPNAYLLDRSLIFEKNKVHRIADTVLQTVTLEVLYRNPTTLIVRGLQDGDLLPQQAVPGAYEGLPVKVITGK